MPINRTGANKSRKKKFVPFGGEPRKDRPSVKESRDEINAIRKYSNSDKYHQKSDGKQIYKRSS